jgi:hypothetical protein
MSKTLLPTPKLTVTGLRSITREQYEQTKCRSARRKFVDLYNNATFIGVNHEYGLRGELLMASKFAIDGMARVSGLSFELIGRLPSNDSEPGPLVWKCLNHKGCRVEGGVG